MQNPETTTQRQKGLFAYPLICEHFMHWQWFVIPVAGVNTFKPMKTNPVISDS